MRSEGAVLKDQFAEFCRKWKIAELRVVASADRADFRPDSDLDPPAVTYFVSG